MTVKPQQLRLDIETFSMDNISEPIWSTASHDRPSRINSVSWQPRVATGKHVAMAIRRMEKREEQAREKRGRTYQRNAPNQSFMTGTSDKNVTVVTLVDHLTRIMGPAALKRRHSASSSSSHSNSSSSSSRAQGDGAGGAKPPGGVVLIRKQDWSPEQQRIHQQITQQMKERLRKQDWAPERKRIHQQMKERLHLSSKDIDEELRRGQKPKGQGQ